MTTSNTLLCHHVYIWSDCGHADSTWRKVPRSLLHDKHRSETVYPHNFRLVTFGKRSYVDRRRNDIASGPIAIKDFSDNLIGSISFHFVQAYCLAWVTALAVLCSSSNILISSLTISLFSLWAYFGEYIVARATQPSSIGLSDAYDVFDSYVAFHLLASLNGRPLHTWFYFWIRIPNDLVGRVLHDQVKAYFPNFEFFY